MPLSSDSGILNEPLAAPPNGQSSNFVNPPSTGYLQTAVCTPIFAIMTLFFVARIYARSFLTKKLGWDDFTCTIGFLLVLTYYVLTEISVIDGYVGYDSWNVKVGQLADSPFYVTSYLEGIICPAGLGFIKLTFFIFYMQIFKPLRYMKIAIWAGAILSTLFYLLIIILALDFTTLRPGETWETHLITPLENDEVNLAIPQAAISVVFDFYILILPIYGVWKLQLSRQRKIAVSLVFLTGLMACFASILTLYYRVRLENSSDLLNILLPTLITSLIEMEIGLICACAPVLSLIGRRVKMSGFSGLLSTKKTAGTGSHSGGSGGYFWQRRTNRSGHSDNNYVPFDTEQSRDTKNDLDTRTYELELGTINSTKLGNINSVKTFIGAVKKGSVGSEEDGIHLKHDILQESINSEDTRRG